MKNYENNNTHKNIINAYRKINEENIRYGKNRRTEKAQHDLS